VNSPSFLSQEYSNNVQLLQSPAVLTTNSFLSSADDTALAEKAEVFHGI